MSTTSARVRIVVLGVPALLVAAGCSLVAGVDFGNAYERGEKAGASGGEGGVDDEGGGVAETPDATPSGCAAGQKTCSGACVSKDDPAYGCGAADCLPCSVPFAKGAVCKGGACAADGCGADRGDCDGDTKNGCEATFSSPATCRDCTTKCGGATPFCAPTGCVSSCPGTLAECNGACVDTKTNPDNCGQCAKKCNSPTNGDPACLNGTCAFACRGGFGDCVDNPAKACNPLPKWYRDQDGDGVGSAVSVQACAPPPGYVAGSGDCLDTNPQVHPGQLTFFGTSFMNGAAESYDYDCSGVEVDTSDHWPGSCAGACDAYGNTPKIPARAGAGVNNYCGSTTVRTCIDNNILQLKAQTFTPSLAPGCRTVSGSSAAVTCR